MENVIYPKQLINVKYSIIDKQCFFIMPFAAEFNNLYDLLKIKLESNDFNCIRVDENKEASITLISMILQGIATSQFIIVDISNPNANVFYELGIAHVLKDMDNVFLIKNKKSTEPFDIKHLQYIPYDENRLMDLSGELVKRLHAKQYKSSLKRALIDKGLIGEKDADSFTNYLDNKIQDKDIIVDFTNLLNIDIVEMPTGHEFSYIIKFNNIIEEETRNSDAEKYLPKLFQMYFQIILPCYCISGIDKLVSDFLMCDCFGKLRSEALKGYQTDLAILFASKERLIDISMNWIVDYFQRSKSTKVDLNRYKLESFLLNSDSEFINSYIANAVVAENKYIREHMADIVGEKQLHLAYSNLVLQLKREENIFAASSIMEALGKLKEKSAIDVIADWITNHKTELISKDDIFVIKHARNAMRRIAPNGQNIVLTRFEKEYLSLLIENNMC